MPLERVKQEFKDISMSFETNPLNDDLIALKNSSAIARSIRNIVFTQPGEKFYNPDFGSRITEYLYENMDEVSALAIRDEIENHINKGEDYDQSVGVAVRVDKFSDSSIDMYVRCFTKTNSWTNYLKVKENLALEIKKIVEGKGAAFAFPSQSIYVEKK